MSRKSEQRLKYFKKENDMKYNLYISDPEYFLEDGPISGLTLSPNRNMDRDWIFVREVSIDTCGIRQL